MVLRHIHTQCLDHAAQYSEVHLLVFLFFSFSFLRLEEHVWLRGVPVYVSVCVFIFWLRMCVCVSMSMCLISLQANTTIHMHHSLCIGSIEILGDGFYCDWCVSVKFLDKSLIHTSICYAKVCL